jgi:hypothetical protein
MRRPDHGQNLDGRSTTCIGPALHVINVIVVVTQGSGRAESVVALA